MKRHGREIALAWILVLIVAVSWERLEIDWLNNQITVLREDKAQFTAALSTTQSELNSARTQVNGLTAQLTTRDLSSKTPSPAQLGWRSETLSFKSDFDGTWQSALLITTQSPAKTPHVLVIYFHSMASGAEEIETLQAGQEKLASFLVRRDIVILSPGYRSAWLNPAGVTDVSQAVRMVKGQMAIGSIVTAGVSMGGTAALIYPLLVPKDITVNAIVAATFASDVIDLWSDSRNTQLKDSLRAAYGGSPGEQPQVYQERAVLRNLFRLPSTLPIALYASYADSMIPPTQQSRLRDALAARGNPLLYVSIPGDHRVEGLDEGFTFVLNRLPDR